MAYSYQIPLSYVINVSLSATPQGLADFNTNSIAIFSNEPLQSSAPYTVCYSAQDAIATAGSNSLTAKMATALFTPVPNFRTGSGVLYIFPFKGENATSASLTTADISANVANFKDVTNGAANFTIDGTTTLIQGLDFSAVKTLTDIAQVIQDQNPDMDVTVDETGKMLVFTSRTAGAESAITISAASGEGIVDLFGSDYLNGATSTVTTGVNAGGQTLAEAVIAAQEQVFFGGILTTQFVDNATALANAQAIQALDKVYYEVTPSHQNISILGQSIQQAGLNKTRLNSYAMGKTAAKVEIATYATVAQSVNYNGSATANTMNLKTLTGVLSDKYLNSTYLNAAKTYGVDIYGNIGGLSVVLSNNNNGYTDDIVNQLWLKKKLEVNGFNYLRQTNTKIPQTEQGMTGLKNAYAQVCEMGVNNGVIGVGLEWNGAIPFGDPEDFKRNIREHGYYIYSIPISQQSQTEREARKAPLVQIAIKFAGAFHNSDVLVNIER